MNATFPPSKTRQQAITVWLAYWQHQSDSLSVNSDQEQPEWHDDSSHPKPEPATATATSATPTGNTRKSQTNPK